MHFRATHRYARIAQRKAEPIMEMVRGMPASRALDTLQNDNHRASAMIYKVLASAVANAMQNPDVRPNRLFVSGAFVQGGPLLGGRHKFRPASMGRAMPIRRRTCHLHIHVSDPELQDVDLQGDDLQGAARPELQQRGNPVDAAMESAQQES